jgi:hypothetical protein
LKEGDSTGAYRLALQNFRFALGRSESWATRAYDAMRLAEPSMECDQLKDLRDLVGRERERMLRARMGMVNPELTVWAEVQSWLDGAVRGRERS